MSQTIYKQLFYNSISSNDPASGVNPRFRCPICRYAWQPKLDLNVGFQETFDYNQKAAFTVPQHINAEAGKQCDASNQPIELHVAVHKEGRER